MKILFLTLCCILAVQANVLKSEIQNEWAKFTMQHNRVYKNEAENKFRFKIFAENLKKIVTHNKEYKEGKATYSMAMNHFGDMHESEFLEKMTGLAESKSKNRMLSPKEVFNTAAPDSIDWREKGAVTQVKDQGVTGSVWAFSCTGSLEGQNFIKTGSLVSLSEKELMDCCCQDSFQGCGWMDDGFQCVVDMGGVDTEESYSNLAQNNDCKFDPANIGATCSGFVDLPEGDEAALKEAVGTVGPISVAVNANSGFQFYSGGVFKDSSCNPGSLNHAMLTVGYGVEDGQDYWLVKNSWGSSWGEQGYIKMARNYNNMCGIAQTASYPTM